MQKLLFIFVFIALLSLIAFEHKASAEADEKAGFVDPSMLEVVSAEFAADRYSKANYDPFIKIRVVNNSTNVITRAFFKFTFSADDGKHLLFSENFVQIVDGGLKPYETAIWKFYPRGSSALALKGLPRDTRITASVEKLFCPKKNSPWQYEHRFSYPERHDFAY